MTGKKNGWSIRGMTQTALMTVIICVCTWICIPGPVPFTLQTFAVFAAAELLGGRAALRAVGAYLLMGAAGLPVFSGMTGGFGVLLGPTGGYLWGFLLIPLAVLLTERLSVRQGVRLAAELTGLVLCYALGSAWYCICADVDFAAALLVCVVPFVVPDLIKLALAAMLSRTLRRHIG